MRILAFLLALPLAAAEIRAGSAQVRITPPQGTPLAGYYYNRGAEGVHDELWAKALVIESGGAKTALVACDLIGIPRHIIEAARLAATKSTGIPGDRIMISATHAHTGPVLPAPESHYRLERRMAELARDYAAALPGMIAQAVQQAHSNLTPARISTATAQEPGLSFNRRFFLTDGTVGWNPGKLNPKIVRPAGPIDPAVPFLFVESTAGVPIAAYINFAMHLDTVGGTAYSADYAYTLSRLIAEARGAEFPVLFTIGAAGNINHIDVGSAAPQKGHAEAVRIGTILAADVLRAWPKLKPVAAEKIQASSRMVPLPLPSVTPAEVERARTVAAKFGPNNAAPFLEMVKAFQVLEVSGREGKPLPAEVQVITLGREVALVGLPGEIFVELGAAIKAASPFPQTIIAELANGSMGYVPNRAAYPQGNYEVVSTRVAAGSGEMLVDAAVQLLREAFTR